jgi:hypothetical protein
MREGASEPTTSRGRRAEKFRVATALLLASTILCSCGSGMRTTPSADSGGGGRRPAGSTRTLAATVRHNHRARWSLSGVPRGRVVRIASVAGYCPSGRKPVISAARVRESGSKVFIVAVVSEFRGPRPCLGVSTGISRTVLLAKALRRRQLYDASESPPAKRWPRGD